MATRLTSEAVNLDVKADLTRFDGEILDYDYVVKWESTDDVPAILSNLPEPELPNPSEDIYLGTEYKLDFDGDYKGYINQAEIYFTEEVFEQAIDAVNHTS